MAAVWIIVVAIVVFLLIMLGLYLWVSYNSVKTLGTRVDEAWSDITVQVGRRADLIPQITGAVQGYAAHDRGVLERAGEARTESVAATDPTAASTAENHVQQALKAVFGVADAYPQLQASSEFLQLQSELVDAEGKIQASRRFYNGSVREFNTKIQVFPGGMFARRLGYSHRDFFDVPDVAAIAEPPRVQF